MKRYELTIEKVHVGTETVTELPYLTARESSDGSWVLASDVADLERRYAEAVALLKSERDVFDDDSYDRWDNRRTAFLAEEDT